MNPNTSRPGGGEDGDLTLAEAEAMLHGGPLIHTFTQVAGGFDGEDRPRHEVLVLLREAAVIRRSEAAARAMGHGLTVLHVCDGHAGVTWLETERRERLHLAIGIYAEYLAGQTSEAEARAAAAALTAAELTEYAEITADLKARFGRDTP